jgi:Holliday junction resolvase
VSFARRVDGNHAEIVAALRKVGCAVLDLSRVGKGCPDLLVSRRTGFGRDLVLLEVKTAKGQQNAAQREFEKQGWPVFVVKTVEDALRVVGL